MNNKKAYDSPRNMFISVIIPTFNMAHCISDCIDSILKQDIVNMEIIIVDDGSKDNIQDVLDAIITKNDDIIPIYIEKNLGVSNARNIGIKTARGEYLHFVDADDTVPLGAYKHMLKCAYENHTDIIIGNYCMRTTYGNTMVCYSADTGLSRCLEENNLSLWSKWFKKSFIIDNKLSLNVNMKTAEDAMFCFQALRKNPSISFTNGVVYNYHYDDTDKDRHGIRDLHISSVMNSLRVLEENFVEAFPEETKDLWMRAYMNYIRFIYYNLWSKMNNITEKQDAFYAMQKTFSHLHDQNSFLNLNNPLICNEFYNVFMCDYFTFQSLEYSQYMMMLSIKKSTGHTNYCNISDSFISECAQGHIGMRTILQAVKSWLKYKMFK